MPEEGAIFPNINDMINHTRLDSISQSGNPNKTKQHIRNLEDLKNPDDSYTDTVSLYLFIYIYLYIFIYLHIRLYTTYFTSHKPHRVEPTAQDHLEELLRDPGEALPAHPDPWL